VGADTDAPPPNGQAGRMAVNLPRCGDLAGRPGCPACAAAHDELFLAFTRWPFVDRESGEYGEDAFSSTRVIGGAICASVSPALLPATRSGTHLSSRCVDRSSSGEPTFAPAPALTEACGTTETCRRRKWSSGEDTGYSRTRNRRTAPSEGGGVVTWLSPPGGQQSDRLDAGPRRACTVALRGP